jgi:phenylalanyl-tRNA synthetase beta chain
MKISIEWLQQFLDLPQDLARLRENLTMAGLVVESVAEVHDAPVFEIEITSNRPDCTSYLGIAREIAALYGKRLRRMPAAKKLHIAVERIPYAIAIRDSDLCPRYVGMVLDEIRVAPSPAWMQRRLEASGMRPVNNIVDITNYVLLERGHPLHAFDFDLLRGGRIVVGRAHPGQKIVTLDGVERTLDGEMLLINDGAGPVAIAGVMGGQNSEIGGTTRRILIECAYFQPASVRRTSRKLGLSTEASYRFERGADWDGLVAATARCCYLIQKLAGGRIAGSVQDVYPVSLRPVEIELRLARAESLLGVRLAPAFVEATLKRLNFKPIRKGRGLWQVACPSYRADMELEADLIEEITRFYGYENIPATIPPSRNTGTPSPVHPYEDGARRILLGLGYHESVSLSFAHQEDGRFFPLAEGRALEIRNAMTEETQFMRAHLTPGLLRAAKHNFNHNQRFVRLFEIGKTFGRAADGTVLERNGLAILGTGSMAGANWHNVAANYDFFHLKGVVSALLEGMRCAPSEVVQTSDVPWLNPDTAAALLIGGKRYGVLGALHPELEERWKLKQAVYVAEIDFQELWTHLFTPVRFEPLPRFPAVERDLSFIVSREVSYGALRQGILGLGIAELAELELTDIYEGNQIPADKVSMTLRIVFRDREGTLTVDRVQGFSDNIRTFLRDHCGAENR